MTRVPTEIRRDKPVLLIDAIGRLTPFHLEFALLAVLEINLRKYGSASMKIRNGEFVFTDLRWNRDIDLESKLCFQSGQIGGMSMNFNTSDVVSDAATCPTCGALSNKRASEETEWPRKLSSVLKELVYPYS
ncbi:hypothetical protein ACHAQJ_007519 [Trichoderma viride]